MNWLKRYKEKVGELQKHCSDLERRHAVAMDRLTTIAAGMHIQGEVKEDWNNDLKLQVTAAKALRRIADMPLAEKPWLL